MSELTRERIEEIRGLEYWPPILLSEELRALCDLALRGLELEPRGTINAPGSGAGDTAKPSDSTASPLPAEVGALADSLHDIHLAGGETEREGWNAVARAVLANLEELFVDHTRLPHSRDCGWYEDLGPGCLIPRSDNRPCERCELVRRADRAERELAAARERIEMLEQMIRHWKHEATAHAVAALDATPVGGKP